MPALPSSLVALVPDSVSERQTIGTLSEPVMTPLWFFRLTHTRLVDSIMDVCGVPQKESARKACLQMFARCSAPAPGVLYKTVQWPQRKRASSVSQSNAPNLMERHDVTAQIEAAVKSQILPKSAAKRLEVFLTSGCSPLPANIDEALDAVLVATGKVRLLDDKNRVTDPRRLRRYEEIAKIVKSLKQLVLLTATMGIGPIFGSKSDAVDGIVSRPLYIALDLGLRQKRKHYNGQLFFQAIVLPNNFFDLDPSEQDTNRKSILGLGSKVAEGGRYDDLVRGSFFLIIVVTRSVIVSLSLILAVPVALRSEDIVHQETLVLLSSISTLLHRFQW